ncbi:MAG TPA: hypothetical protein VM008_14640 [Phycisphaerae bacterium]|nr:hypothetical protein [Phycisphaerae bacterium]
MKSRLSAHAVLLAAAVLATGMMNGCEADESAPTRPRTQNILTPDEKAKENADKRVTEPEQREMPTGRTEFPGQSRATPKPTPNAPGSTPIVTADAGSWTWSHFRTPTNDYDQYNYGGGPVPPLNEHPGKAPTPGSTPVPGTPWSIGHYWGEIAPLDNYPHRAWPDEQVTYVDPLVKHNPVYFYDLQKQLPITQNDGTYAGDLGTTAIEFPWFYVNTVALPVLMVLEPPLAQRTTERLSQNPVYLGFLPSSGAIIPSPQPGVIEWKYKPDYNYDVDNTSAPEKAPAGTNPESTTAPTTQPNQ